MIETAVALVFAHLLADFVLQNDRMVGAKRAPRVMLLHIAILSAASWAALGLPLTAQPILLIAGSHLTIDLIKLRWGGVGFATFAADQLAHLVMIALVAGLYPDSYGQGFWAAPDLLRQLPALDRLPEAFALAAGLIATVWAGGYAVRDLMSSLKLPPEPEQDNSLPQGGRLIGRLERLMILMLVLAGQADATGLLIAAKSILRFNELAHDKDRRASEYVIIGTLASFAWALAISYATTTTLAALQAP